MGVANLVQPPTQPLFRPELAVLREQFDRVRVDGAARLLTLTGPGGIGKTTMLKAFMTDLLGLDEQVRPRVGYGAAGHTGDDYATIRWALRSLLDNEQRRGRDAARRVADVVVSVAPEWLGAIPAVGGLLKALAVTVDVARRSGGAPAGPLADQLMELLLSLAQERPVVLLLDDLHWADGNTAGLIFDVCRAVREVPTPALIVTAYRLTGYESRPITRTVRSLVRYVPTVSTPVGNLDVDQSAQLVNAVTGAHPPAALSRWLHGRTGGNPLFIAELARTLARRGFPEPDSWTDPAIREAIEMVEHSHDDLPESVEALLEELLEDLAPAHRRVLDVSAVLGDPVDPADLFAVADLPEPVVRESLRALCQHSKLLVSAEGDLANRYRFTYDLLADLLLGKLRADRYDFAELHRRCAGHVEAHGDRADFATWERLVRHWAGAGRLDCAVSAAHRAVWSGYLDAPVRERGLLLARRVARWAADSGDGDLAGQAHMMVAEALQAARQPMLVAEEVDRAERVAPPGSVARAHVQFFRAGMSAATNRDRGRYELAQRAADHLAGVVDRGHEPPLHGLYVHLLVTALYTVATQATAAGSWDVAEDALAAAGRVDTARWAADWGDWSHHVLLARAGLLSAQHRWAEAVTGLRAAVRHAEEHGNRSWLTGGRARLGIALCHAGQEEEGLTEVEEGLRLERDVLSSPSGVAGQLRALGEYYLDRGELLVAAELFLLAEPLYQELGHIEAARTAELLARVRDGYGAAAFATWRSRFRAEHSRWAPYALLWGLGPFRWHPRGAELPPVRTAAAVLHAGAVNLLAETAAGEPPVPVLRRLVSGDGFAFTGAVGRPVPAPAEPWETPGGCRNPRVTRAGERFVLTYAAGEPPVPAAAHGSDLSRWTKDGPLLPDGPPDAPAEPAAADLYAAVLLGEPVDGRWWMYFGAGHIWAAWTADPALRGWRVIRRPVVSPRPGAFDARLVAPGPPPVWLPEGIVLVYNGVDDTRRRAVGQVLLATTDPTRVLRRSPVPLLSAEVPPLSADARPGPAATGLVQHDGTWLLYCATGDSTMGVASATYPGRP